MINNNLYKFKNILKVTIYIAFMIYTKFFNPTIRISFLFFIRMTNTFK